MSEDLSLLKLQKTERLIREKNALRDALEKILLKPKCSACILTAQHLLATINNE